MGGKSLTLINLQPSEARPRDRPEPRGDQALDVAVKSVNKPQGPLSLREFQAQAALYSPIFERGRSGGCVMSVCTYRFVLVDRLRDGNEFRESFDALLGSDETFELGILSRP